MYSGELISLSVAILFSLFPLLFDLLDVFNNQYNFVK